MIKIEGGMSMAKARNMYIEGFNKGYSIKKNNIGEYPIRSNNIESYKILSEESYKNVASTITRGVVGTMLIGGVGASAALTGKEDKIYTIYIEWHNNLGSSIIELDQEYYKLFITKCQPTPTNKNFKSAIDCSKKKDEPPKYIYNYEKWLSYNNINDDGGVVEEYLKALNNFPSKNPVLDCCRSINPEWEEYMQQSDNPVQNVEDEVVSAIEDKTTEISTDIKSKLKELKSLFEEDLITEAEYTSKKKDLLSKL